VLQVATTGGDEVDERLEGTVALVTGASSGIGEATARLLAARGAAVAIAARRSDRLEQLAAEIESKGGRALVIEADVTDREQAIAAVERTAAELGRLDILVNNAGVMLLGPALDAPLEEWERTVDLNVKGLLYCTHAALPHLLAAAETEPRKLADLVNISSVAGRKANAGSGIYNLSKFGVGAFSESLRMELAKRHVRVSLIEPGFVKTELSNHIRDELREAARQRYVGVEMLEAEDIADAIAYVVTRPRRMAVNEMLVRPTEQEF
jgi:NADP-dependent 3-hydroxy acid dehydrogenase YdfG